MLSPIFMDYEKYYDQNAREYAKKYGMVHADILDRFLVEIPLGAKVLDVGCGPGQDVDYFTKKGFKAVGIDIAPGMIRYAEGCHQGVFILGDVFDSALETDSFQAIWSASSIFTHLRKNDRKKVLMRIHRLLVHDGIFGVVVRRKTKRRKNFYSYSKEEIISEIGDYKFSIEEADTFLQGDSEWIVVLARKV